MHLEITSKRIKSYKMTSNGSADFEESRIFTNATVKERHYADNSITCTVRTYILCKSPSWPYSAWYIFMKSNSWNVSELDLTRALRLSGEKAAEFVIFVITADTVNLRCTSAFEKFAVSTNEDV